MNLHNTVVNFLGDSITQGVGASCTANRYTDVLAREFGLKQVNNYGVSGSRIARQQILTDEPHDRDFCMRMTEMDPQADAVVVFGGTNDYGHGEAPLGVPGDRQPDTFWGACHYLMDGLLTRYAGKPVVILTPLHRLDEQNPRGSGSKPHSVAPPVRLPGDPDGNSPLVRAAGAGSVRGKRHPARQSPLPGAAASRWAPPQRCGSRPAGAPHRPLSGTAVKQLA